jgi:hypothetical protein
MPMASSEALTGCHARWVCSSTATPPGRLAGSRGVEVVTTSAPAKVWFGVMVCVCAAAEVTVASN